MDRRMVKILIDMILGAVVALIVILLLFGATAEEEEEEQAPLYVTAEVLNGREWPSKRRPPVAYFEYGEELTPTGNISRDKEWIEVYGGEPGTVWVHRDYVSERMDVFTVINENHGKIRVRKKPFGNGRLAGYVGRGEEIEIDQVIMGWGHCKRGWVDLDYFIEEVDHN